MNAIGVVADEAVAEDAAANAAKTSNDTTDTIIVPNSSIDCNEENSGPTDQRRRRRNARWDPPQRAPLYAALFCSSVAIAFSVRAHLSTRFVSLEEPLRVGPFFKSVDSIGLSTWELCAIKQEAFDELIAEGDAEADEGDTLTAVVAKLPWSTTNIAADVPRHAASHERMQHHYTPHSIQEPTNWREEPDHDDILVSGDYPYNDDDAFESDLPENYWSCHYVQLTSKNAGGDKLWNAARVFFMLGSILGCVSTGLLVSLIVVRGRDAKRRWSDQREANDDPTRQNQHRARRQRLTEDDAMQPEMDVSQLHPTVLVANNLVSLDTDASGYRPISVCYLMSYLVQSLTLIFLDSEICRNHVCSISAGAHGLIAACVLWVVCGLLILRGMNNVRKNKIRVRRLKKKKGEEQSTQYMQTDVRVDDSRRQSASGELCIFEDSSNEESQIQKEDTALDATVDTESTDIRFSLEESCD